MQAKGPQDARMRNVSCRPLLFDANASLASLKQAAYKPKSLAVWCMR